MPQHNLQWLKENLTSGNWNSPQRLPGLFPSSRMWLGGASEKKRERDSMNTGCMKVQRLKSLRVSPELMSWHKFVYMLLNLKIYVLYPGSLLIQKCNRTYSNSEDIYIASLNKFLPAVGNSFTSPGCTSVIPSIGCAVFANSVLKTHPYSCHITEIVKCLLCYARLNKVFESEEEMLWLSTETVFSQVLKMLYKQEVN